MMITPSMSGSIMSGATCWTLFWSIVNHIESIPLIGRLIHKEKIYRWVNRNKVLTITTTEVVNLSVHGVTSPLGPMMAAGGSVVNLIVIFALIPFRQRRIEKKIGGGILQGV